MHDPLRVIALALLALSFVLANTACSPPVHSPSTSNAQSTPLPELRPTTATPTPTRAEAAGTDARARIVTAAMEVEVDDVPTAADRAVSTTLAAGGHVDRSRIEERSATLRLRVPRPALHETLDRLGGLGAERERSLATEDVTAEAIDLRARIQSLETLRSRLLGLLETTRSIEQALEVEQELLRVRAEIDALRARLAQLESRVDLATIDLDLATPTTPGPLAWVAIGTGRLIGKLFVWD